MVGVVALLASLAGAPLAGAAGGAASGGKAQDALPRSGERLAIPIRLAHCPMPIVEWRSTGALAVETSPSRRALEVVDAACARAFESYGAFLRSKHLPQPFARPDGLPAMSILPANVALDGRSSRALNDVTTRFEAVAPGCCYWGLYVESLNHLFLRNDPLTRDASGDLRPNPRFVRTFTHEIAHVLGMRLGVWSVVPYDRRLDEELAEQFVIFMGMTFPVESSSQDLALHNASGTRNARGQADWRYP
ncbi:MAG: hypothetical protein ACRENE_09325 [Polyangiaceae bacterium]